VQTELIALNRVLTHCVTPTTTSADAILFATLTPDEHLWAYSTVATRACYYAHTLPSDSGQVTDAASNGLGSSAGGDSALVPFFDLLNHHSACSGVWQTAWHRGRRSYELRAVSTSFAAAPGTELFISYGDHSNRVLLQRYGFVLPDNAHERVMIGVEELEQWLRTAAAGSSTPQSSQSDSKRAPTVRPPLRSAANAPKCSGAGKCALLMCATSAAGRLSAEQAAVAKACGLFEILDGAASVTKSGAPFVFELVFARLLGVPAVVWCVDLFLVLRCVVSSHIKRFLGIYRSIFKCDCCAHMTSPLTVRPTSQREDSIPRGLTLFASVCDRGVSRRTEAPGRPVRVS
jgi:hypothetical protein